eukprot:TRINITY_DN561_c0_g1_i2.p1 TRINITY_DN561_c0_g1~~TRINITY_DN561_c0_g1_i2.p1  ORF type:complete len:664 (+),score=228.69 TRINITY_DN561_c0_g1_i2:76-2067(+)
MCIRDRRRVHGGYSFTGAMSKRTVFKVFTLFAVILVVVPSALAVSRADEMGIGPIQQAIQDNTVSLAEKAQLDQDPPANPANQTANETGEAKPAEGAAPADPANPADPAQPAENSTEPANATEPAEPTEPTEDPRERFARILAAVRRQIAFGIGLKHSIVENFTEAIFSQQGNLNDLRRQFADLQAECASHFTKYNSIIKKINDTTNNFENKVNETEVVGNRIQDFYKGRCEGNFLFLSRLRDIKRTGRLVANIREWLSGEIAKVNQGEALVYIGDKPAIIKSLGDQLAAVARVSTNLKVKDMGNRLTALAQQAPAGPEALLKQLLGLVNELEKSLREEVFELVNTEIVTYEGFADFMVLAEELHYEQEEELGGTNETISNFEGELEHEETEFGICQIRSNGVNQTIFNVSESIHSLHLERKAAVRKVEAITNALHQVYLFWVERAHVKVVEEVVSSENATSENAEGAPADAAANATAPAEGAPADAPPAGEAPANPNPAEANATAPADQPPAGTPPADAPPADAPPAEANATAPAEANATAPAGEGTPAGEAPANPNEAGATEGNATTEGTAAADAAAEDEQPPLNEEIVKEATDESKSTDDLIAYIESVFNLDASAPAAEGDQAAGPEAKSLQDGAENPANAANATAPAANLLSWDDSSAL